jgi:hypothetical protein
MDNTRKSPLNSSLCSKEREFETSDLPSSFFQTNLDFEVDFAQKRRYQTDSFSTLTGNSINENSFRVGQELFSDASSRAARLRSTSLSLPQRGIATAFGTTVFSSWDSIQPLKSSSGNDFPESVEEATAISAITRTIDYLGLDDPLNSPQTHEATESILTRPRSVSFQDNYSTISNLIHPRSTTVSILESNNFSAGVTKNWRESSPEIASWDEMTQKYQSLVPKAWDESSIEFKEDVYTESNSTEVSFIKDGSKPSDTQEHITPSR